MRRLLWLLALCALAVVFSLVARFNEGFLLLVLPPYRAEISLNLAMLLMIVAFALLYGFLRGVVLTVSLPERVRAFRDRRRREQAAVGLHDAIQLIFAGRFSRALKKAGEAHAAGESPALAALVAARAAQQLGEAEKATIWLDRASLDGQRMQPARLLCEAEMSLDRQDFNAALATLQRLRQIAGHRIAALRLELRAQQGCGNWTEVLRLARLLKRRQGLPPGLAQEIILRAHQKAIQRQRADPARLLAYLQQLPVGENTPDAERPLAQGLLEHGAHDTAKRLIEGQIDAHWDSALARLRHSHVRADDLSECIRGVEQRLPEHPADAPLLLALGRICLAQRLWSQAEFYLEASLVLAEPLEVHLALAQLFEQTERPEQALAHYRAATAQIS